MEELVQPLTLQFTDQCLERDYRVHRLRAFFRALDTRYLTFQTLLAAGFFLLQPFVFPSIAAHWTNVGYPITCLVNVLVISLLSWPTYERYRHIIQLLFRAVVDYFVLCGLPAWSPPVPIRSTGTFVTHLILTSGVGCLNWASIGWPLPYMPYHLPYNLLAVTAFSHVLAPHVCGVLHQNDLGRTYVRVLWAALRRAAALSSCLRLVLHTHLPSNAAAANLTTATAIAATEPAPAPYPATPSPSPSAAAAEAAAPTSAPLPLPRIAAPTAASPAAAGGLLSGGPIISSLTNDADVCWASITLVQILLGSLLPSALVYILERSSRDHFLRTTYPASAGSSSSRSHSSSGSAGGSAGAASGRNSVEDAGGGGGGGGGGGREGGQGRGGGVGESGRVAGLAGGDVSGSGDRNKPTSGPQADREGGSATAPGSGSHVWNTQSVPSTSTSDASPPAHPAQKHVENDAKQQRRGANVDGGGGGGGGEGGAGTSTATAAGSTSTAGALTGATAETPALPAVSPAIRQQLRLYRRLRRQDGWNFLDLLYRALAVLLLALLVLLLWEVLVFVHFLLPSAWQSGWGQEGAAGRGPGGGCGTADGGGAVGGDGVCGAGDWTGSTGRDGGTAEL